MESPMWKCVLPFKEKVNMANYAIINEKNPKCSKNYLYLSHIYYIIAL